MVIPHRCNISGQYFLCQLGRYISCQKAMSFDNLSFLFLKNQVRPIRRLAEAAQAHRDLEGRKTTGSTIFKP